MSEEPALNPICERCGVERVAEEWPILQHLKDCFPHYAAKCLMIRTKEHGVIPFILNDAQEYIHNIAEQQLREFGWVRIIVLKGRQLYTP